MKDKIDFPKIDFKGNYIEGAFRKIEQVDGTFKLNSPAAYEDEIGEFEYSYASIGEALDSATSVRKVWSSIEIMERIVHLQKFLVELDKRKKELCTIISREVGKPIWESERELEIASLRAHWEVENLSKSYEDIVFEHTETAIETSKKFDSRALCRFKARGISVVLGHFNCPVESPLAYIVPNLLFGNAVIFKPSKRCAASGQLITECIDAAGFPKGTFNLIQGGRELARRLAQDADVETVFYAGDFEFGKQIRKDTFEQGGKLLYLETGGKNPIILCEDANVDKILPQVLYSSYLTGGQRAYSCSRILLHESLREEFIEKFHRASKKFLIDYPLNIENPPFLGSLTDNKTLERYLQFQGIAIREGAECIMRGKQLDREYKGHYVAPSIYYFKDNDLGKIKKSIYLQTEIFGPSVGIHAFKDDNEAIALANASKYGLCASVITDDVERYQNYWQFLKYGQINWNEGTVRKSFREPSIGIKNSSLAQPAFTHLSSSILYSVSSLESKKVTPDNFEFPPGLII